MFTASFFPARFFAPRFFPEVGVSPNFNPSWAINTNKTVGLGPLSGEPS